MADINVGSLLVDLRADVARLQRDMSEAKGAVSSASAAMQSTAKIAGTAIGAAFAGISVAGLVSELRSVIDYMDTMGKSAQRLGMTTEAISSLAYAGKLADVDLAALSTSVKILSKNLSVFDEEGRGASAALQALGIDAKKMQSAESVMDAVSDAFSRMEDGVTKTALAMAIFGKSGSDMIPLLNGGANALKEAREEAAQFGVVVGRDATKAAEEFNDNLTRLEQIAKGVGVGITNSLLGPLGEVASLMVVARKNTNSFAAAIMALPGPGQLDDPLKAIKNTEAELLKLQNDKAKGRNIFSSPLTLIPGYFDAEIAKKRAEIEVLKKKAEIDGTRLGSENLNEFDRASDRAAAEREAAAKKANADRVGRAYRSASVSSPGAGPKAPKDDPSKHLMENAIRELEQQIQQEKTLLGERENVLRHYFESGFLDEQSYYSRQDSARAEALEKTKAFYASEIDTLTKARSAAEKQSDKAAIDGKIIESRGKLAAAEQEAARVATESWFAREKAAASAAKAESDARQNALRQIYEQTDAMQLEIDTYGKLASEIQLTLAARAEEKAYLLSFGRDQEGIIEQLKAEAEARRALARAMSNKEALDANKRAADESERAWNAAFDRTGDALADAIMRGGKSAGEHLRDYFKTLVLTPVIQAGARSILETGGSAIRSASSLGGISDLGTIASSFGGSSSIVNAGSWLASLGGSGTAVNAIGSGLSAGATTAGTAAGFGNASALMAGGETLAGVAGYIGAAAPYMLAAYAAYKLLGQEGGGPKSLATAGLDTGKFTPGGYNISQQANLQLYQSTKSLQDQYATLAQQLGGTARDLKLGVGLASDPQGTAGDQLAISAYIDGQLAYAAQKDVGRGEGASAVTEYMTRTMIAALKATDLEDSVDAMLANLDPATSSLVDMTSALDVASAAMQKAASNSRSLSDSLNALFFDPSVGLTSGPQALALAQQNASRLAASALSGNQDDVQRFLQASNDVVRLSKDVYAAGTAGIMARQDQADLQAAVRDAVSTSATATSSMTVELIVELRALRAALQSGNADQSGALARMTQVLERVQVAPVV